MNDWFAIKVDGPQDEIFEDFLRRKALDFYEDSPEIIYSEEVIPDYPPDCIEYSSTIQKSHADAENHKTETENVITFFR